MRHGFRILQHLYVTKQQGTVIFQQFTQEETQLANPPAQKKKKRVNLTNHQRNENEMSFLHSSQII